MFNISKTRVIPSYQYTKYNLIKNVKSVMKIKKSKFKMRFFLAKKYFASKLVTVGAEE